MTDKVFKTIVSQAPPETDIFVRLSFDISDRLHFLMQKKGWSGTDLAKALDKTPSEISRYLSGMHNFTLQTLAKLEAALGEPVLRVLPAKEPQLANHQLREALLFAAQNVDLLAERQAVQ